MVRSGRPEALAAVGGFVLVNDFSARDVQFQEMVEGLMGPGQVQRLRDRAALARVGADGLITQSLHGPSGSYREIVGVRVHRGWLYLGSLHETAVGRVRVPD
jgi:hypothetical protein